MAVLTEPIRHQSGWVEVPTGSVSASRLTDALWRNF
jgi:hypothetical protein